MVDVHPRVTTHGDCGRACLVTSRDLNFLINTVGLEVTAGSPDIQEIQSASMERLLHAGLHVVRPTGQGVPTVQGRSEVREASRVPVWVGTWAAPAGLPDIRTGINPLQLPPPWPLADCWPSSSPFQMRPDWIVQAPSKEASRASTASFD